MWARNGPRGWAVAAGVCFGLMLGTKENSPLFAVAALGAALAFRRTASAVAGVTASRILRHGLLAAAVALVTAALLYSSFGTNPAGLRDALASVSNGINRMSGSSGHEKPWWYYLRLFAWQRNGGLVWEQVAFSLLALGGLAIAFAASPPRFLRWAAIYTLIIITLLSISPYKTPWHSVHFVPGLAILAAGALAAISRLPTGRIVASAFAFVAFAMLTGQMWRTVFVRPIDARNPYAYVHSSPDVLKYRPLVEAALARTPGRPVRIISEEYWPLPWYLRGLPQVGYWSAPPDDCDGALLIVSATQGDAVRARLHGGYDASFLGLRPGFICLIFTPTP